MEEDSKGIALSNVIRIDDERVRDHLGRIVQGMQAKNGADKPVDVSPADAAQVTPDELREISATAEKQDPGIFDKIGAYYAQHPEVVKVLGGAALAIALGRMANRSPR